MLRRDLQFATPLLLLSLSPLFLFPTGCLQGAQLENEEELKQALGCDIEALFLSCDGGGCHQGTPGNPPDGAVDFFLDDTRSYLVGMQAKYPEAVGNYYSLYGMCPHDNPELIIDPANPDNSLFLRKLNKTQTCGTVMPPELKPLTPGEIECFREWVIELVAASSGSGGATGSGGAASGGAANGAGGASSGGGTATGGSEIGSGGGTSSGAQ